MISDVQEIDSSPEAHPSPRGRAPLVALMGASFDTGNMGVSALVSGTVAAVRSGMPGARVLLLDYGKAPLAWAGEAETFPLRQVNLRFSKRPWVPNHVARLLALALLIRVVPVRAWRIRLARRSLWLRRITEPDFHLSLAGGDSFSDIYGLRRLVYMALPQVLVLLLEKPLILLPQTYGPFKGRLSRAIARGIVRRASAVYSRDREGLRTVDDLRRGRGPWPRLAYDLGFALEPHIPAPAATMRLRELKEKGPLVGFNVSGLLDIGGYGGGNRFGLQSDYGQLVQAILRLFISEHRIQVLLIPHVHGEEDGSESDVAACQRAMRRFGPDHHGRLHSLDGTFDHHETKHVIGQCDFFLGSRMHSCIAALSQCVPAVGLAYSRKFAGVMELVGGGAVIADLRTRDLPGTVAAVNEAWLDRAAMRGLLLEHMPAIRESVLGFFRQQPFQNLQAVHP